MLSDTHRRTATRTPNPMDMIEETVAAKDWWLSRDKPKVFPIPSIKDPD